MSDVVPDAGTTDGTPAAGAAEPTAPTEQAPERVVRKCDVCGQEDDHPHHVQYAAVSYTHPVTGETVTEDISVSRHFDCCNCPHCAIQVQHAAGKKGPELVAYITSAPADLHAALNDAGFETGAHA